MVKTRRQECDRPVLKWRKGQRVYSKWKDCKTYPGKVKAVNHDDDTLMIEFDDGIIYRVNAALVSRKLPRAVSSVKQKDNIEKNDVPKPYNIIATSGYTKNSNNQSMDILANERTKIGNFKENVQTNVETNRKCNTMGQNEAMNTDTENDDPTDVTRTNTDFGHLEENNTVLTMATTDTENANGKENNYVDSTGKITISSSDEEELDLYYNSESEYKPSKESEASDESDLELNESHFEGSEKDKFNNNETDAEIENSLQYSNVASPQTNANPQKQSAAMEKSDLLAHKQHAKVASCKSFSSIHVMTTSNDVGARKWDKKAYCLYCEKAYSKLTRHLTTMHTNESEVARYLGETDGKKKTAMLCKLRNLGNHVHNCAVLRRGEGSLLVSYRPSKLASAHSYTPCEYCYGYYAKYELWRHKCPLKPVSSTKGKLRQRVLSKSRMLLPTPPEANAALTEVLATMRSDDVSRVCKSDTLILQLARKETFRVGHEKDSHNYIRSKMRELGRLLVCLRTRTGLYNSSLKDFIEPTKFKDVVEAAREVSQFNEVTHEYATPSLALKLGHTLKKCAKIMKGNALQCGDVETTTRADAFSTLCELKWTDEVSTHALRTLQLKKRNSAMILPLANDVKVLTKHLQDQTLIRRTILVSETASMEERKAAWSTLNEITLTQIILFNRRRQGEVSRIEVSQYGKKHAAAQGEIGEMLSTIEQGLCKLFARLEIKGKRGSTVPVLLTSSVQESLDLLIQNRAIAGVDPKNVYLFARSNYGSMGHIRGSDCLRQFSSQCGALHPEHIRSTKLRKHVATMSQILNLQEQEMDLLAQFMGHDIRVHRQYYRLPEGTLQVAKLSKLFLAMENGTMANNAGKRLEDIDIQPDEEIQQDDDSAESDNESDDENTVMDASKYQPLEREIENIKVAVPRGCGLTKRTSVKRRPWTEEEKAALLRLEGVTGQSRGVCEECYRNSKSCRIISGIFTRTHLTYGYNRITQIPAGSCDIDISEMSRSRNYLALQLTNGSYFINGDWRLVHTGNYFAAGTNFTYGRFHGNCPGECIRAKGPTSEAVDLLLLFYRTNPGIKYQYTIPAVLMERVIQTYQSDPVSSSTWAHRRRHHHFTAPLQTNSSSEFTNTQHTPPKDKEASDQSFGRSFRFGPNPRYIAPEVQTSNYEPLQSNQGQYGTQEAINRFRAGSSNQVDTRNQIQLQTDQNRVETGSVSPNYRVDDANRKQPIYSQSRYDRTRSQTSYDIDSVNQIENQPRIATTIDRINFMWRISGFTECSQTCGGGTQNTNVVCMKRNTNVIVTEDNCDKDQKPRIQTLACNQSPCPPSWETEPWSECSATCGVGMQRRRVECKQRIAPAVVVPVSASLCTLQDRPISSQSCQNKPCAQWEIGNWTKCSVECGQGEKTREVYCKSVDGKQVPDEKCEGIKSESSLSCDMGSCAQGWFHSEWSDECSTECGNGYHTRKVFCSAEDGTPLPDDRCVEDKPKTHKSCKKNRPCGGSWFTGPWSKCSNTCGSANRIRDVLCMKKLGDDLFAIVSEENCQGNEKPTKVEECPLQPECEAEWFMTAWSECSATCDTGTKTREIKCLDLALQPSTSCDTRDKPSQRHTCNTESCDRPQLDQDPGCIDKWKNCKIVVQARLCSYYKNQCCKSCNDHEQSHHKKHNRKVKRG